MDHTTPGKEKWPKGDHSPFSLILAEVKEERRAGGGRAWGWVQRDTNKERDWTSSGQGAGD